MAHEDRLQLEACKNARLMGRVCDLLEGGSGRACPGCEVDVSAHRMPLEELRSHVYTERELLMRDYDPDVDGWPWETPYL